LGKVRLAPRWLVVGSLALVACETLYGFDSPRPSLGQGDGFKVDPACADLPVDPSALAAVPTVVTLTGRRETGLGAEGVPVSVTVGSCNCEEGDCPEGSGGASPAAGGMGGGGGASELASGAGAPECVGEREPLSSLDASQFALQALDGRGCEQRSPSRLDCTLDASGDAAFGVISRVQDAFNLVGYLPVCVQPLELGQQKKFRQTMAVVPRVGSARVALAVVQVGGQEPQPPIPSGATCDNVLDCGAVRARAQFQVGVVSADLPAASVRSADFRSVTRDVSLTAELRVLSAPSAGPAPFITARSDCAESGSNPGAGGQGGQSGTDTSEVPLHLSSGQSGSEVFYLCAPAYAGGFEVTASLSDGGMQSPQVLTAAVNAPPLTHAYLVQAVQSQRVLFSETCGMQPAAVSPAQIPVGSNATKLTVSADGTRVLVTCDNDAGGAGGAASDGASGAGGATPTPPTPTPTCPDIDFTPGPQGSCTLKVSN
jgi:hypothetical protein